MTFAAGMLLASTLFGACGRMSEVMASSEPRVPATEPQLRLIWYRELAGLSSSSSAVVAVDQGKDGSLRQIAVSAIGDGIRSKGLTYALRPDGTTGAMLRAPLSSRKDHAFGRGLAFGGPAGRLIVSEMSFDPMSGEDTYLWSYAMDGHERQELVLPFRLGCGSRILPCPDLDNDSFGELLLACDSGILEASSVRVLSGRNMETLLTCYAPREPKLDVFGFAMCTVGDYDGDTIPDILVAGRNTESRVEWGCAFSTGSGSPLHSVALWAGYSNLRTQQLLGVTEESPMPALIAIGHADGVAAIRRIDIGQGATSWERHFEVYDWDECVHVFAAPDLLLDGSPDVLLLYCDHDRGLSARVLDQRTGALVAEFDKIGPVVGPGFSAAAVLVGQSMQVVVASPYGTADGASGHGSGVWMYSVSCR